MISWDPKTNCLTAWEVPEWPKPLCPSGWGCEVGNWFGFFAHEQLGGIACQIERSSLEPVSSTKLQSSWWIKLPRAKLCLNLLDDLVSPQRMVRTLTVKNHSPQVSWLGDAVLRMVIPWEPGLVAEVEGTEITHTNSNSYHDTEARQVGLKWPDGRRVQVSWLHQSREIPALTPYLYVRDQAPIPRSTHIPFHKPAWVVHARLLVDYPTAWVYRFGRLPLTFWSRGILGRYLISPPRLQNFWRSAEWKTGLKRDLYGLWPLMPSQSLAFSILIEVS